MCSVLRTGEELKLLFSKYRIVLTELIYRKSDSGFITVCQCLLAAIKAEEVVSVRYGQVVSLAKIYVTR